MISLPPFSGHEAVCPKCLGKNVTSTFLPASLLANGGLDSIDKIERRCGGAFKLRGCGYLWHECPADAHGSAKPPVLNG